MPTALLSSVALFVEVVLKVTLSLAVGQALLDQFAQVDHFASEPPPSQVREAALAVLACAMHKSAPSPSIKPNKNVWWRIFILEKNHRFFSFDKQRKPLARYLYSRSSK